MPWGAWVTCEETVNGPDVGPDFTGASNVPLHQAARLRLRGAGQPLPAGPVDAEADHAAPAGSPTRRCRSTRKGGHLYLTEDNFGFPSGFYRYMPPSAPDARRPARGRRHAADAQGQGRRQRPPRGASRRRARRTTSSGSTSTTPTSSSPTRPASPRRPRTTRRSARRQPGPGPGRGPLLPARGPGLRRRRRLLHLHPGRRPAETGPTPTPAGYGKRLRPGVGLRHRARSKLRLRLPVAGPRRTLDLPDNITTSKRGTLVVCEDSAGDNYIRGLTRKGELLDIALNRLRSSTGARPVRRRVRRLDLQPRRADALRQHPGVAGHDVRDLGAVERSASDPPRRTTARTSVADLKRTGCSSGLTVAETPVVRVTCVSEVISDAPGTARAGIREGAVTVSNLPASRVAWRC